ncbi:hypothetical protein [Thermomonospora umbrina]|uniref:SUKH superfamily protein n=1 Tax=Thermomonospora umbrina TaxID=111806 RepID=A0A3D9SJJ2_9ACTN|nr:hypothetical protein [Thermomonospora umbrina]REE96108.1 hypothetical protein DFJ69_1532 [Thermomonospora umbrina]
MTDDDRLETAWEAIVGDFPLVDPQDSGPAALAGLYERLVGLFAGLGVEDAATRVRMPADLLRFLALAGGTRRRGDEYGLYLFGPATVASQTAQDSGLFAEHRPVESGLWLTIGSYGDKHVITLCCDADDARFGVVVDGHDDHPWNDGGGNVPWADSFTGLLTDLGA